MTDLDWQNASEDDCTKANEFLGYLSSTVLDYDYLVRIVAAALASERASHLALLKRAQAALAIWNDPDDGAGLPAWEDGPWKTKVLDTIKAIDAALEAE